MTYFLVFLWLFGLFCAGPVLAISKNVTIDDADGANAKSSLTYFPNGAWIASNAATHGRVFPEMARAHAGTWHDTTQDSERDTEQAYMELSFEGALPPSISSLIKKKL